LTPVYTFGTLGFVKDNAAKVPRWLHFLGVVFFGALMGAGAGWSVLAVTRAVNDPPQPGVRPARPLPGQQTVHNGVDLAEDPEVAASPGGAYALALVNGDYEAAVDRVLWMTERLNRVRAREADEAAVAEAKEALILQLSTRTVAENQLTPEGVEDEYVFASGSALRWLRHDEGRDDLEAPVARRDWIRVTYPSRTRALRDLNGIPIRSIVVGINTDRGGQVLKAGVVGNLEIDPASITYDWD